MEDFTWTVAQIRQAEQRLRAHTTDPEAMMQAAASAVARAAGAMLERVATEPGATARILILAGPGGNGGDGLYAGALLAKLGHTVEAVLTASTAHQPALEAFTAAGGTVVDELDTPWAFHLAVDAITGIGGRAGLDESLRPLLAEIEGLPVLAVDVPSGIAADTGEGGALHITADATITFGGWRRAHVINPACGDQLLADISVGEHSLAAEFEAMSNGGELGDTLMLFASRAVAGAQWPAEFAQLQPFDTAPVAPGPTSDKYTGGVVGITAGSAEFPGAAVLCCLGAVNATPGMVRYAGPQAREVVRALPEVVAVDRLEDCGRVQAWVFGPGSGPDSQAQLRWLLARPEPLLIDATGLTLLSSSPTLRELLVSRDAPTVLTPHDGEFARLYEAAGCEQATAGKVAGRLEETLALAAALRCTIVRKGRSTIIAADTGSDYAYAVDAGHSWAATPGSGDVLSGLIGARIALAAAADAADDAAAPVDEVAAQSVVVHAVAAKLAAATPFGDATAPASRIAAFLRDATAALGSSAEEVAITVKGSAHA